MYARLEYSRNDFGEAFNQRFETTRIKASKLQPSFELCSKLANKSPHFLTSIVFPEMMRYSEIKDGIESESLKVLYVQLGQQYADFSIGPFQMKPSFAEYIEEKVSLLLDSTVRKELNLAYNSDSPEGIRQERVNRLMDQEWQQVYLTAFVLLCDQFYKEKIFQSELEKMQWYAAVYNGGFDKSREWIRKKIEQAEVFLKSEQTISQFNYGAIATLYIKAAR